MNVHRKMTTPRFDMHHAAELGVVLTGRMRRYAEAEPRELGVGTPGASKYNGTCGTVGWPV